MIEEHVFDPEEEEVVLMDEDSSASSFATLEGCPPFEPHKKQDSIMAFGIGKRALVEIVIPKDHIAIIMAPFLGVGVLWIEIEDVLAPVIGTHATGKAPTGWMRQGIQAKAYVALSRQGVENFRAFEGCEKIVKK